MDNFHKYTAFFFFISGKSDNFVGLLFRRWAGLLCFGTSWLRSG